MMFQKFMMIVVVLSVSQSAFANGGNFQCTSQMGTITISNSNVVQVNIKTADPTAPSGIHLTFQAHPWSQESTVGTEITRITKTHTHDGSGLAAGDIVAKDQLAFTGTNNQELFLTKVAVSHNGIIPTLPANYTARLFRVNDSVLWKTLFVCSEK